MMNIGRGIPYTYKYIFLFVIFIIIIIICVPSVYTLHTTHPTAHSQFDLKRLRIEMKKLLLLLLPMPIRPYGHTHTIIMWLNVCTQLYI